MSGWFVVEYGEVAIAGPFEDYARAARVEEQILVHYKRRFSRILSHNHEVFVPCAIERDPPPILWDLQRSGEVILVTLPDGRLAVYAL